jgi:Protein of unknown function (DUF4038)/Domain of unknown function (DUF5060)
MKPGIAPLMHNLQTKLPVPDRLNEFLRVADYLEGGFSRKGATLMTKWIAGLVFPVVLALTAIATVLDAQSQTTSTVVMTGEQNQPSEWGYTSQKTYKDPFNEVDVDVVFTREDGQQWKVPAFWAGGNNWRIRFSPPASGNYKYHAESTDKSNPDLNGHEGTLRVEPYKGSNSLLMHGPLRVSKNHRYFEYADGTPFFWLGDTWWDGLCTRISLDEFKTLAADRQAKGFDVVQIIAGLDPDESPFDIRGRNEGGYVWEPGFARINPAYFDAADARIQALVKSELTPAIVGSWGFYLPLMGMANAKKHWRNLIARYGAYPVVWIITGEVGATYWLAKHPHEENEFQRVGSTELAKYVRSIDPYNHLITAHPSYPNSARHEFVDESALDFDMLQTGHSGWESAANVVAYTSASFSKTPAMPELIGETMYEGHTQSNWQDNSRFAFWASMMNGSAGHTYGAGGIWQMNGKTVPHGPSPTGLYSSVTYDNIPWDEAMRLPGSRQVGIGKSILTKYPWWRFEPHPEWVEPHGTAFQQPHSDWFDVRKRWAEEKGNYLLPYASGIPGEIRFVYVPPGSFLGPLVSGLEKGMEYRASYYDPMTGEQYKLGTLSRPTLTEVFDDSSRSPGKSGWHDSRGQTSPQAGQLLAAGSTWGVFTNVNQVNELVSVEARSDSEAGILLRFHDPNNSLVAVYSATLKGLWIHDRQNGEYGPRLGLTEVPEIGPRIHLVAETHGTSVSLTITDGQHTYRTSPVLVTNIRAGSTGVWSELLSCDSNIGGAACRPAGDAPAEQSSPGFEKFAAYRIEGLATDANPNLVILNAWRAPNLPLMHDWVLVLER